MVRNRYKVSQRTWRKWSDQARNVFNTLYGTMIKNPSNYQHSKAVAVPKEHWEVTAWNAAWIAAHSI